MAGELRCTSLFSSHFFPFRFALFFAQLCSPCLVIAGQAAKSDVDRFW